MDIFVSRVLLIVAFLRLIHGDGPFEVIGMSLIASGAFAIAHYIRKNGEKHERI